MTARPSIASIAKSLLVTPRPAASFVALDLPLPPSANALFFNRTGGRAKTKQYYEWLHDAGWALIQQKPGRIAGAYQFIAGFERVNKRSDLSNRCKALEDLLVKHGVIEDDSLAESITLYWLEGQKGVRVTIRSAE